jgi:hypothetical protein
MSFNSRKNRKNKKVKGPTIKCDLLIKKTDENGEVEFSYCKKVEIPSKPKFRRNDLINSLGMPWGHSGHCIGITAAYLSHSPSLEFAKMGLYPDMQVNIHSGRVQTMNLDNLGCMIEFTTGKEGENVFINTNGPDWMTPEEVKVEADKLENRYKDTHSILRNHRVVA